MALSKAASLNGREFEPICLIDFDNPQVNEFAALERLLTTIDPLCKIVPISVVGRRRGGKSFLLGFFIRYLRARCGTEKKTDDWMEHDAEEELVGFRWEHTTKRVTRGILIWPELFKINEEVVVILMDTQGIFDDEATLQTDAYIFSLSLLLSSVQIFNIKGDLDRDYLNTLDMFTKIARLASGDPSTPTETSTRLSQKLIFLLRDWQNSHEFDYGWTGGQDRLDACRNGASASTLATISESFHDELECFLMPRPGDEIVEKACHKLSDIRPTFKHHVKEFVEHIFRPENLERMKSVGKHVTSATFARVTERCIGEVGGDRYPVLRDVVSRVAAENINVIAQQCMDDFQVAMTQLVDDCPYEPDVFEQLIKRKVDEVLNRFNSAKKIKVGDIVEEAVQNLTAEMDFLNRMFRETNRHWNEVVEDHVNDFELAIKTLIIRGPVKPEEFDIHFDNKLYGILHEYDASRITQFGRISDKARQELAAKMQSRRENFKSINEKSFREKHSLKGRLIRGALLLFAVTSMWYFMRDVWKFWRLPDVIGGSFSRKIVPRAKPIIDEQ